MGRILRRVPPYWRHPQNKDGSYRPCHDMTYEEAVVEWKTGYALWEKGKHERQQHLDAGDMFDEYWDWAGPPPEEHHYRPPFNRPATYYQVYETISYGTPVSPKFKTLEKLEEWMVKHGDFWCIKDGGKPPSREAVKRFLQQGEALSMAFDSGVITETYETLRGGEND